MYRVIPDETLRVNGIKSFEREALWQIRRSYTDYPLWSKEDYDDTVKFFTELTNEAGWPSKTGNPSGSGRYNNV